MKTQRLAAKIPRTETGQGFAPQITADLAPRVTISAFSLYLFAATLMFLFIGLLMFIHNIGIVENHGKFGCETYLNQSNITVCS